MADRNKESVEYISITLRMVFLVLGGVGFAMSIACLDGCDYVRYIPRTPPEGVEDNRDDKFKDITIADVGLFKYDPNFEGCRAITDDFDQLTWQFTTAQVCATLATILAGVAIVLLLVDFCLCRFPCGRMLIAGLFFAAFVSQILTNLVYAAKICDPNYENAPFPCEPETATFFSIAAIVLFLLCALMACCVPKPQPLCLTTKRAIQNDKSDECCVLCAKKDSGEEKEEEETAEEEQEEPLTPEEVHEQQTRAAVTTALTTARLGQLEEIEKELVMLEKYKEHIPEDDYATKVATLMALLPDPENYVEFTKTRDLVVLAFKEEPAPEEGEGEEGVEVEEAEKKSRVGAAVAATGSAMAAAGSAMKKPFTKKSAEAPGAEEADADADADAAV